MRFKFHVLSLIIVMSVGMAAAAPKSVITSEGVDVVERADPVPESSDASCFSTVSLAWDNSVDRADREVIFYSILEKVGHRTWNGYSRLYDIDYSGFGYFHLMLDGKCNALKGRVQELVKYAVDRSIGGHGYGAELSHIDVEIEHKDQSDFISNRDQLTAEEGVAQNFRRLNQVDDLAECTIRLSFPVKEQVSYTVDGAYLRKEMIYFANYYWHASEFFGFPILIHVSAMQIGPTPKPQSEYDYLYLIYYDKCGYKLEMTKRLNAWANRFVGIPIDMSDVEISGDVTEDEILKALGSLK